MNPTLKRTLITVAAITTAIVGLLVLIGWQFDIEILKSPQSSTVSMKANTAFAFLLSGLALIFLQQPAPVYKILVRICGLLIAVIGLLSLSEYLFGWNLGIDEIIFRDVANAVATSSPGRMAPNTALNFALIGMAIIVFTFQTLRNKYIIDFAVIFSLTISILGLIGYATDLMGFAGTDHAALTKMAEYTAITFIFLCAGILTSLYEGQLNAFAIKQKLFAGLSVVATIIVFVFLLFSSNIRSMYEASRLEIGRAHV